MECIATRARSRSTYQQARTAGSDVCCKSDHFSVRCSLADLKSVAIREPINTKASATTWLLHPWAAIARTTADKSQGRGFQPSEVTPSQLVRSEPFSDGKMRFEPNVEVEVDADQLLVVLNYEAAQHFAALGSWVARRRRPTPPASQGDVGPFVARDWWTWIVACVKHDQPPRSAMTWPNIKRGCDQRRRYAELYKRKIATSEQRQLINLPKLSKAEEEELQSAEDDVGSRHAHPRAVQKPRTPRVELYV